MRSEAGGRCAPDAFPGRMRGVVGNSIRGDQPQESTVGESETAPFVYEAPAPVPKRRLLGAYYTPDDLATVLVRWALADGNGPVLDPSYGGCAFLEAAARVLSERDPSGAGEGVYGVDIDPACAETANASELLVQDHCIQADFLGASPSDLPGSPYAAIVGNPPYVRHHWIAGDQRESARAVAAWSAVPLPATASLWAYFLLHSLRFLATGGRLAMLVPEAIVQTDYAVPLRTMLTERFANSRLIHLRDRQFEHTNEAVVALACSGFGRSGTIETTAVGSVEDLGSILSNGDACADHYASFPPTAVEAGGAGIVVLKRIQQSADAVRLEALASIKVGVVTGANRHFIRSQAQLDSLGVPVGARHGIVARTKWLKGLAFTGTDYKALVDAEAPALLVRPEGSEEDRLAASWIAEGTATGIDSRYKCALRSDWFRIDLPCSPDAFATCARAGSPLLILNRSRCLNTNAIHSVRWKSGLGVAPEAVAVGFLTSAASAWAELSGRRYGGGVLKIEPGTLKRLPVAVVRGAEDVFDEVDHLLREGREEDARSAADERVLRAGLGLRDSEIATLRELRAGLMEWRRPSRGSNGHG